MARRAREKRPKQRAWQPMERHRMNPAYRAAMFPNGEPEGSRFEVWANDLYSVVVEHSELGWAYMTIKRLDRHAIRDWRHLQSIKNECVGPEREAFEIFPAESRLMDTANQYHLWVLPEGQSLDVGERGRQLATADEIRALNEETGGAARQRDWQPGLSTGPAIGEW